MHVDTDSCDHLNTTFLEFALDFYQDPTKFLALGKQVIGPLEPPHLTAPPYLLNCIGDGNAQARLRPSRAENPPFIDNPRLR